MVQLKLEQWPIDRLKQYENNAKLHPESQVNVIAKSIKAYDFNDPIGVDENGVILEGHGRLAAAKRLGLTHVPVLIVSGFKDEKEKALYRIAHNKLTLSTGFDVKKLAHELNALAQYEVIDITDMGFDEKDLTAILRQADSTHVNELPPPVFKYTLVFSDEEQQKTWKRFIAKLKVTSPDSEASPTKLFLNFLQSKYGD